MYWLKMGAELVSNKKNNDLILNTIEKNPGIYQRKIMLVTDLKTGVVTYHLRKLEKQGKVVSEKNSGFRKFYPIN